MRRRRPTHFPPRRSILPSISALWSSTPASWIGADSSPPSARKRRKPARTRLGSTAARRAAGLGSAIPLGVYMGRRPRRRRGRSSSVCSRPVGVSWVRKSPIQRPAGLSRGRSWWVARSFSATSQGRGAACSVGAAVILWSPCAFGFSLFGMHHALGVFLQPFWDVWGAPGWRYRRPVSGDPTQRKMRAGGGRRGRQYGASARSGFFDDSVTTGLSCVETIAVRMEILWPDPSIVPSILRPAGPIRIIRLAGSTSVGGKSGIQVEPPWSASLPTVTDRVSRTR